MNKKEVLELKHRLKKDNVSFTRMCGCYVSGSDIVFTMNRQFLTLEEDEFNKYLDIAKKSLGGKLGNNLLNIDFPIEEEKAGGRQQMLMALRDSELKDENLLNTFYEHVIDTYDTADHYLILLFMDNYDVVSKAEDHSTLEDSDEVYNYILCSICPVSLSKSALGYKEAENTIESTMRNWIVGAPESAFLFPAFNDRSTDIHSALFYSKKAKDIHDEFIVNGLGCESVVASDVKKDIFQKAVASATGYSNDDGVLTDDKVLGMFADIGKQAEDECKDLDSFIVEEDNLEKVMKDNDFSDKEINMIKKTCSEMFDKGEIFAADLFDEKEMEKQAKEQQYRELVKENERLKAENEELKKKLGEK